LNPALNPAVIQLRETALESTLKCVAFDASPLPTVCVNGAGRMLAANAVLAELTGVAVEACVGRQIDDLFGFFRHRRFGRRFGAFWSDLSARGQLQFEAKMVALDGRRLVLSVAARAADADGETIAVVVLRDVTAERERLRTERARQDLTAALSRGTADVSLLLGRNRRIVAAIGPVDGVFGAALQDILSVPFDYLLDDASAREFTIAFDEICAERARTTRLITARSRGSGAARPGRPLSVTLTGFLDRPRVDGIAVLVRDISEVHALRAQLQRLQRQLRAFAHHGADVTMVIDDQGIVTYQSPALLETLGIAAETTLGRSIASLVHADDRPALLDAVRSAAQDLAGRQRLSRLVRAPDSTGSLHRIFFALRNCRAGDGLGGVLVTGRDVTGLLADASAAAPPRRQIELLDRLLELAMRARGEYPHSLTAVLRVTAATLNVAAVGYWRLGRDPETLRCEHLYDLGQQRFAREWSGAELTAAACPGLFGQLRLGQALVASAADRSDLPVGIDTEPRLAGVRALVATPILLDGRLVGALLVHDTAPRDWAADEVGFLATVALMVALALEGAQRQEAESRIEQLAWYDGLTGLPNRNLLRENLRDLIMSASNRRRRIAVMLIDLDRFKDVNDTLGHLVGDALIKSAAQVLRETVGDGGIVARLGGDEFVVLVGEFIHRQEVALLAARIAQALHRSDLVPSVDTQVSASIGVALFPEHGREMGTLLKNADAAMYQAKRDGRNQFSFFNPFRYERAAREVQLGIDLMKALQVEPSQFLVHYQPQVEMATGQVIGLEALIRWNHPRHGLLEPDRFIGVAEVSGLSDRVTRWVINEVCGQVARWRRASEDFDIPVAINVAGRELGSTMLPTLVRAALAANAIDARMITLEITERTLVDEGEINNDVMADLASLGVGLALDDFGTGYSTLGYLKRMPIQSLKIDQSFIVGVPEDADSCAIVLAMLAVARHFRLKVIAEGVERVDQVDYLRSIGCEFAQGYRFARALPPEAILDFIAGTRAAASP
jgi:diguanylate cyclase (GGDEF)-like protein/PAS domain S-box-containing protein